MDCSHYATRRGVLWCPLEVDSPYKTCECPLLREFRGKRSYWVDALYKQSKSAGMVPLPQSAL
jgi:hypothetical protein